MRRCWLGKWRVRLATAAVAAKGKLGRMGFGLWWWWELRRRRRMAVLAVVLGREMVVVMVMGRQLWW